MVNPSGTTAVLLRVIFLTISMVSYLFARYTASYGGSAPSMSFTELSVWDPLAWRASWVLPVDLTSTGVGDVIGKNGKTRKVCTIGVPSSWAFTCKKKPRNRKPSATMARKGPISCFSSSSSVHQAFSSLVAPQLACSHLSWVIRFPTGILCRISTLFWFSLQPTSPPPFSKRDHAVNAEVYWLETG